MIAWAVPYFLLFDRRSIALLVVAVLVMMAGLGATYGPQAALFAELFPVEVRYSGASMASAFGAVVGGGSAPRIATSLLAATGTSLAISGYVAAISFVSLVATALPGRRAYRVLPPDLQVAGARTSV